LAEFLHGPITQKGKKGGRESCHRCDSIKNTPFLPQKRTKTTLLREGIFIERRRGFGNHLGEGGKRGSDFNQVGIGKDP